MKSEGTLTGDREMKAWNIQGLKQAMDKDLAQCNDAFERSCIRGICTREIRELAQSKSKLSPSDIAILEELSISTR
jgi:hypothetical protein